MSIELSPCSSCQRHIRVNEKICPFCKAAAQLSFSVHAAAVVVGAALALSSCAKEERPANIYGGPPVTQPTSNPGAVLSPISQPVSQPTSGPREVPVDVPAYGAPPNDYRPKPMYGKPPKPK